MVVTDEQGAPLRAAKLWNDTESAPDAEWLRKQLGDEDWARACGSVPVAAFTIAKLSWLHRSEPDTWTRVRRVCLPHDWLTFRLSGELVTDRGDASGTGYFSAAENEYRFDLLAIIDRDFEWEPRLPRVCDPYERIGNVAPGTGDNMAAALGLALAPGDVAVSIGTSGTVFAVSDTPTFDASGAVAGFADATGRFLPLVCTLNATKVTDAVARLLGIDHAELDTLALASPPGAEGVTVVPYFDGERTPNRPDARGTIAGLRSDVTREQLARAAFEGVICGLLDGWDALSATGVATNGRLFVVGGGAHSRAFVQVLADLAGRPVYVPKDTEQVVAGACVQAAAALHGRPADEIGVEWKMGAVGAGVEPTGDVDRDAIRARYHAAAGVASK
jgi:xylulokinase